MSSGTGGLAWSALLCLAVVSQAASAASAASTSPSAIAATPTGLSVHRVIVKLRSGAQTYAQASTLSGEPTMAAARARRTIDADAQAVVELAARNDLTLRRARSILPGLQALSLSPLASGQTMAATLARLRADPAVESAEADQQRHILAAPDDPLYVPSAGATGQWYLQNSPSTPSAIDALDAWSTTTGRAGLVIADIDTGVRFDHPDLLRAGAGVGGRLLPGYTFISDVLAANDGALPDGSSPDASAIWDADASDPGDWISAADLQIPEFSECTQANSSWHGTRVVGILGAITNNNVGIAGLTWNGWILPVRALGKCGGADSDIQTAMLWAAGLQVYDDLGNAIPVNPYPAQIINLSLGATGSCPSSYQPVLQQLQQVNVTVVAAAGNEGGPVDAPGNCNGVIAVAGLRQDGTKVGFSSLGPQIALSAPGGNCVNTSGPCEYSIDTTTNSGTTTPGPTVASDTYTNQTNYNVGTSFATPLVAGTAGLMLSVNGNLLPAEILARLQEGAQTPFPVSTDSTVPTCHVPAGATDLQTSECNCTTAVCGAGMANASGAVAAALRPIAAVIAPASLSAGSNVTLDASGSSAACGHTLHTYSWSATGGSIVGATTHPTATVVAPSSGTISVQVTVTDYAGRSDSAQVEVTASAASASRAPSNPSQPCLAAISPALPITVTLSPSSASVQAGLGSQAFAASVTSTSNQAVSWQVNGIPGGNSSVGTVSDSGVYTPPLNLPTPSNVSVLAVSLQDGAATGFAGVTITAPVTVTVTPGSAVVLVGGGTQAFQANVSNAGANTAVTWQVNSITGGNASVGTISSTGLYTAPATIPSPATVSVRAVAAADPTRSGSASVTIANIDVSVSPSVASVVTGATQAFAASVVNTSNIAVSWQVNGATGGSASTGTISTSGVYTAPAQVPAPAIVTVTAVSNANPARTGSAQVTIIASSGGSGGGSSNGGGGSSASHGGGGALRGIGLWLLGLLAVMAVLARRRHRPSAIRA
jgi:serine protease